MIPKADTKRTGDLWEDGNMWYRYAESRPEEHPSQDLHLGEGGRIQLDSDQWSRPQLLWGPRMTEEDWSPQRAVSCLLGLGHGNVQEEMSLWTFYVNSLFRKQCHLYINTTQWKKGSVFKKAFRAFECHFCVTQKPHLEYRLSYEARSWRFLGNTNIRKPGTSCHHNCFWIGTGLGAAEIKTMREEKVSWGKFQN